MEEPPTERLYNDPSLARFYDRQYGWDADFDYCARLADDAESVLDLGCGTGELAAALAGSRHVAGVDPAAAMLEIARARPGGTRVDWHLDDARSVRLGRRFDLIVLTGHAFQVFLAPSDQKAVLETIAAHLSPDGRFIFDSRNPALRVWETWHGAKDRFVHPDVGAVEKTTDIDYEAQTGIVTYRDTFRALATGDERSAASRIRFTPFEELADLIAAAGLKVERWLGDWQGSDFAADAPEIIPLGRLA